MEDFANDEARRELLNGLEELEGRADLIADEQEATIVRILARSAPEAYRQLVEEYLFERPVAENYSMVLWTLWPNDPRSFGKAFAREIAHLSPERLRGTAVFQGLYSRPEAIAALKSAFEEAGETSLWDRTRDAIRASPLPSATASQRADVARILE